MADHERHQATFTTIPEELSTNIIEHLDVKALTALSRTSPPFYRLANPLDISRRPQLENFLLLLRQKKNSPYPRLLKRSRRDSFLDNLSGPPKGSVEAVIVTWPGDPRLREALLRWNKEGANICSSKDIRDALDSAIKSWAQRYRIPRIRKSRRGRRTTSRRA